MSRTASCRTTPSGTWRSARTSASTRRPRHGRAATAAAGPFFYVMAARARKVEPDTEDAERFRWHHGQLNEGHEYFALEYPVPVVSLHRCTAAGRVTHSSIDQTWSVSPAAIAG